MATAEKRSLSIEARLRDQVTGPLARVQRGIRGFVARGASDFGALTRSVLNVRTAIVGLAGALAVRSLARGFNNIAKGLEGVGQAADRLGVTTESLFGLRHQAELAGVQFDELSQALLDLQKNVGAASDGASEQQRLLLKLGLTTSDFAGRQLDAVDVLSRVADGLGLVTNQTDRARIVTALFGDAGSKLVPLLNQGSAAIRRQAEEVRALGGVFSGAQLQQVEAFRGSVVKLEQSFQVLAETLVVELSPILTELFRELARLLQEHGAEIRRALTGLLEILLDSFGLFLEIIQEMRLASANIRVTIASVEKFSLSLLGMAEGASAAQEGVDAAIASVAEIEQQALRSAATFDRFRRSIEQFRDAGAATQAPALPAVDAGQMAIDAPIDPEFFETLSAGIEQASQKWRDFTQAAFQSGQQLVDGPLNAFQDALGSIIDGTKSGSEAFKDFGRQTLKILAQVIARLLIVRLLSAVFPGAGPAAAAAPAVAGLERGGVLRGRMGEPVPLRAFASGGIATGPTLALFGEGRQAEAFVPLPDGRSIPVSYVGPGPSSGPSAVNIHVQTIDQRGVAAWFVENKSLIRSVVSNEMEVSHRFRQRVRRTARP